MDKDIRTLVDKKETFFTETELSDFLIENSNEDGTITKDVVIFEQSYIENSGEFVMSDYNLNRQGMRVNPDGWILKNYKKNPVLLWNHDHNIPAIGRMTKVRIENNKLMGKPEFASKDIDEFAWSIGQKVDAGYLSAGSVGFNALKVKVKETKDEDPILVVMEQELYEYSIVNIPALPSGLVKKNNQPDTRVEDSYIEKLFVDDKQKLTIFKEKSQETSGTSFFNNNKEKK